MKKLLVLLLCFNIVLAPTYAFANTSLGGWTITSQIAQGASTVLNTSKTVIINGANVVKTSTAKITPNASQVAKVLRGGAAGYALSIAVEQILGAGVDWVLDPSNNQIRYLDTTNQDPTPQKWHPLVYSLDFKYLSTNSASSVCDAWNAAKLNNSWAGQYYYVQNYQTLGGCKGPNSSTIWAIISKANPIYDPNAQPDRNKSIPLDVVAQKVIDNAESSTNNDHKVGAQTATTTAAQDMLANDSAAQSDVETQLNTNAKTQTSEEAAAEATPKDPALPQAGTDIKITFPVFCSWAPTVCEASNVVINFPTTLTNWWNTATQAISASWLSFKEWLDWTKNDSELPDNQTNEVTELPIPELQENAISWSASCPPDVQVPINLYGQSSTLTFSWSPWCQLLNIIKPAIIASAYIGAAFIVLGLRT